MWQQAEFTFHSCACTVVHLQFCLSHLLEMPFEKTKNKKTQLCFWHKIKPHWAIHSGINGIIMLTCLALKSCWETEYYCIMNYASYTSANVSVDCCRSFVWQKCITMYSVANITGIISGSCSTQLFLHLYCAGQLVVKWDHKCSHVNSNIWLIGVLNIFASIWQIKTIGAGAYLQGHNKQQGKQKFSWL